MTTTAHRSGEPPQGDTDLKLRVGRLEDRLSSVSAGQQKLEHVIMGNGTPGLAEQLRALTKSNEDLVERTDAWEEKEARVLRWLLAGGLSAAAAVVWQVIVYVAGRGGLK